MPGPHLSIILIVTLLFVLVNGVVEADTVAITARQTVVRAGPDGRQRIFATVPQGTTLALSGDTPGLVQGVARRRPGGLGGTG